MRRHARVAHGAHTGLRGHTRVSHRTHAHLLRGHRTAHSLLHRRSLKELLQHLGGKAGRRGHHRIAAVLGPDLLDLAGCQPEVHNWCEIDHEVVDLAGKIVFIFEPDMA